MSPVPPDHANTTANPRARLYLQMTLTIVRTVGRGSLTVEVSNAVRLRVRLSPVSPP